MEEVFLRDIADVKTGKYDANHGNEEGPYKFYTCAFGQFLAPTYSFEGEAIVLPGNGANVGEVFFNKGEKFEAYQRTYVVHNLKAHVPYVYYYFKTYWKNSLRNSQFGSATNYIRLNNLTKFKIVLPSLDNQKRIAQVLSNCESLIQKRKESISLLNELLKSTFLEMFLQKNKREKWKYYLVDNLKRNEKNSIKSGPFGSSLKKEFYVEKGYKIYGQEQVIKGDLSFGNYYINEEKYQSLKSCKIQENDVLISLVGTYGKIVIVPKIFEPGIINPRLMKISFDLKKINPFYFKYYFKSDFILQQLKKKSRGGTMDIINSRIVKKLNIPVPPIKLQNKFATILEKVESIKKHYQTHLQELENLYGSISQKAFKGALDLSKVLLREIKYFSTDPNETPEDFKKVADAILNRKEKKKTKKKKKAKTEKKTNEKVPLKAIKKAIEISKSRKKAKTDITNIRYLDFIGMPTDLQMKDYASDYSIEADFVGEKLFAQFYLKDNFKNKEFTLGDVESKFNRYYIPKGQDFNYETWKKYIFNFLEANPPLVKQIFDEKDNTIKLKLTDEAYKA